MCIYLLTLDNPQVYLLCMAMYSRLKKNPKKI